MSALLRFLDLTSLSAALVLVHTTSAPRPRPTALPGLRHPATPADSTLLNSFKWRNIGPERGGRSIAVSGVRGQPNVAYFGATGGGLWKTTDSGQKWAPVTDGQITSASVGAVAVSETDPSEVIIGTGECEIRGNIMPGDGMYRSTDAGKTWTHVGFENTDAICKVRVDPSDANIVFAAVFGKYAVPSADRGVYKSTDGGVTWKKVLFRDDKHRRDRRRDRPQQPEDRLRRPLAGLSQGIHRLVGRRRVRIVQVHRRRRDLDRDHAQPGPARRHRWQDRHRRLTRQLQPRLRARRERQRRALPLRRRRRHLDARQRQPRHPAARLLLHARLRRPQGREPHLHAEHEPLQVHRRRQDAHLAPRHARRLPRPLDRSRQRSSTWSSATTAAAP